MKKRAFLIVLSLLTALSFWGCAAAPAPESVPQAANTPETTAGTLPPEETAGTTEPAPSPEPTEAPVAPPEVTARAIWQDPQNVVLLWENREGCEYTVLRSTEPEGEYLSLGTSLVSSFRDDTARHPNTYYYKLEEHHLQSGLVYTSQPVQPEIAPEEISSVSVIMYHNFVSPKDIYSGVLYDEYAISPAAFEEDLIWIRDNGYVTITSAELLHFLETGEPIPEKAVILSIDDGSLGVYTNALPLLIEYNMKADFNVIGSQIDETWDLLDAGGTREGLESPYCTWEELLEMIKTGHINLCSHTYGFHVFDRDGRIGMSMVEGESAEDFAAAVKEDYDLVLRCIEGWTGIQPETVAYPYSRRSSEGDRIILDTTGYKLLMGGQDARGTSCNYFVKGCDYTNQLMLLSRSCRMDGTSVAVYLNRMIIEGIQNGVNIQ